TPFSEMFFTIQPTYTYLTWAYCAVWHLWLYCIRLLKKKTPAGFGICYRFFTRQCLPFFSQNGTSLLCRSSLFCAFQRTKIKCIEDRNNCWCCCFDSRNCCFFANQRKIP